MAARIPRALIDAPALTRRLYALNTTAGLSDSGLQILLLLAHTEREMRPKEIGRELALEQSRTSHLLMDLVDARFITGVVDAAFAVAPTASPQPAKRS